MGWKQSVEVELPASCDSFSVFDKIYGIPGLLKVNIVTSQIIRIYYDRRKLSEGDVWDTVAANTGIS